ncbi:hypothetical protein D3C86_1198010 [compost metagenome]
MLPSSGRQQFLDYLVGESERRRPCRRVDVQLIAGGRISAPGLSPAMGHLHVIDADFRRRACRCRLRAAPGYRENAADRHGDCLVEVLPAVHLMCCGMGWNIGFLGASVIAGAANSTAIAAASAQRSVPSSRVGKLIPVFFWKGPLCR